MSAFPDATSFATSNFATRPDVAGRLVDCALGYVARQRAPSLLDLGCGSGGVAVGAASKRDDLTAVALDISPENVKAAEAAAERAGVGARVTATRADYLTWGGGEFDVIVSDSVLHIIPATDAALAARLSQSLKPGGALVATIPAESAGNRLRILLRRAWRAMPPAADRAAFAIAKRLHPDFPAAMLQDRLPYLRFVPERLHGPGFSAAMARCGLDEIADEPWDSPSMLKLEHRLIVWKRRG